MSLGLASGAEVPDIPIGLDVHSHRLEIPSSRAIWDLLAPDLPDSHAQLYTKYGYTSLKEA
ncbi:hypothetical protein HS1genome_1960 [Sulfodiicoccus acidiphilus]|uniref:Uncharacterized protein n=1 Tax=Sulfodiicoccus acidiphilus TaxID=1670455 RepID=A0A348B5W9_9CREN|nr:hypothetical protein HS1genome_1960 [Sulfodiicoccus acidiphilus]GGU01780.1 hypothetical protein GCM10007116_18710 [Sulfodiicoccus acidiphilus]